MSAADAAHGGSRRERARAATVSEIKATASQLMRERGTTDVKFSDIAREMGMTAPALYRYFADRDELLTAMIADAYGTLAERVSVAREAVPREQVGNRLLAVSQAYRLWARAEPEQFALAFGMPVPGYVAPETGPTTEAAQRAMAQLAALFTDASSRRRLRKPLIREVGPALSEHMSHKQTDPLGEHWVYDMPAESEQAMLHVWAALHGFVCLEAYGHLGWLSPEAADDLFLAQVRLAAKASGLPEPDVG